MPSGYLSPANPADDAIPVTPNDGADLSTPCRALLIATGGALRVITMSGVDRTYPSVPSGLFPVGVRKVFATSTTAAGIVGIV